MAFTCVNAMQQKKEENMQDKGKTQGKEKIQKNNRRKKEALLVLWYSRKMKQKGS